MAISVSLLISVTAWGLLRGSLRLELDGVPEDIDRQAVADWLGEMKGVNNVHDLHIWALSTTRTSMAVHLVWEGEDTDAFPDRVTDGLECDYRFSHATVQIESTPCERAATCIPA